MKNPLRNFQNHRLAYLLVLFLLIANKAASQRFYAVVFDKLPQDYQLYPRNESNVANVPVNGIIEFKDWNYMSVQVLRNGKPYSYKKAPITYQNGGNGRFATEVPIKAELAEYEFLVYAVKSPDSVLMVHRKNVVAGDVFLVSGQSNSYNGSENSRVYKGEFARSFGYMVDYTNYNPYNPVDTLWDLANNRAKVGLWASEFQRFVIEKQQIPVCIINGGSGGSSMQYNLMRSNDPADLNTSSGRLYYRAKKAGLLENIKAFIYRQGEFDANDNSGALIWKESMLKHIDALKKEYPGLKHFYIPQINVLEGTQSNQGLVRESQRQLTTTNPLIKGYATIGTQGYDGVHYSPDGHFQSAAELYRIVAASQYGVEDKISNYSPNIKRAYYSTADKINVVLEFDQSVIVQSDTTVLNQVGKLIKRNFGENLGFSSVKFPNNKEWIIQHVKANDNKVLIQLYEPPQENLISYIPTNHPTSEVGPFAGPFIKNATGMRAFAFQNIPIEAAPPAKSITSKVVFSQIPQDYELVPRDLKSNLGQLKISGVETSGGFEKISMIILRGKSKVFYSAAKLTYQNNAANFNLSGSIYAEKLNYSLRVYLINSKNDSTLVASRSELVAGDVLIINGNKHVSNGFSDTRSNQFIRTFGAASSNLTQSNYNPGDTLWTVANSSAISNIGSFSYNVGSILLDKTNIPQAIINAADQFSTTSDLSKKDTRIAFNLDKLAYRINKANLGKFIRAYFLNSGELDTKADLLDWGKNMNQHLTEVKKILPNQPLVFIGQLHLQTDSTTSAQIRELQRKVSNAIIIPTYGIKGFDGMNYSEVGILNFSNLISKIVLSHLYDQPNVPKSTFPNLIKASQSSSNPSKITLTFESISNIQVLAKSKDFLLSLFKLDQKSGLISDVVAQGNQLIITTNSAEKRSNISFLSSGANMLSSFANLSVEPITNLQGQAILSFNQVAIQQALPGLNIKGQTQAYNKVAISWSGTAAAKQFRVERKLAASSNFQALASLQANQLTYVDQNPIPGALMNYRVFALGDSAESEESNVVSIALPDSLAPLVPKAQSTYNSISLTWNNMPNALGYIIEKKSAQGLFSQISQSENTRYTDGDLNANTFYEYKIKYFTADGISKSAYLKYQTELPLSTEPASRGLRIFPNPTQDKVKMIWDQPFIGYATLYELTGKQVISNQLNSVLFHEFDLGSYPVGTYILQITDLMRPTQMNILKVIRQD